ncbi:MAG: polymerase beta protein [Bacteroidetes bacterium]|nr:polymerase beta protein [Bacteroidota bacterium]
MRSQLSQTQLPDHLTIEERDALRDLKSALGKLPGGAGFRILLFGSKARGDYDENSDLDLAIIVDHLDSRMKRTVLDVVADIELQHLTPISALVLSSEEFQSLERKERRISIDILREGIPL